MCADRHTGRDVYALTRMKGHIYDVDGDSVGQIGHYRS